MGPPPTPHVQRATVKVELESSNLIYRTRLKLAASMLHFDGCDDFEDYFGPRWHCYLGDAIASIPVPFRFATGEFESGIAGIRLREFAADPYPYLGELERKKMARTQSDLHRKFQELALDESAESRYKEWEADRDRQEGQREIESQTILF